MRTNSQVRISFMIITKQEAVFAQLICASILQKGFNRLDVGLMILLNFHNSFQIYNIICQKQYLFGKRVYEQQNSLDIIFTILLSVMNFVITGKKMRTTSLYTSNQKPTEIITPFMIQSKPITQKIYQTPKKKPHPQTIYKSTQKRKQETTKIQVKKQAVKKSEVKTVKLKVQQPRQQITNNKSQAVTEAESKIEDILSQVIIRYNHYKHPFVSVKGILSFAPIEEKYSFSDVFHGNFQPIIKNYKTNELIIPETKGKAVEFSWKVQQNAQYRLEIEQDQEQESKHEKRVYKAPQNQGCPCQKKQIIQELTQQLKRLQPSQYGGAKHRLILQQRDLQELLFS